MEHQLPNSHQLPLAEASHHFKAEGAFIASAAGDALGWPQEIRGKRIHPRDTNPQMDFVDWVRVDGGRFYRHKQEIRAGEYSDDTQLILAVARCRTLPESVWWQAFTRTELPLWRMYERGGGASTKRAATSWARGRAPWENEDGDHAAHYFDAGGNGAAMRILPHAVYFARSDSPSQLMSDIFLDGISTHGHPRAIIGAEVYGFAAWSYLRSDKTIAFGEIVEVLLGESRVWGALPTPTELDASWWDAANSAYDGTYGSQWSKALEEMLALLESVRVSLSAGAIADDEAILHKIGAYGRTKGAGTITVAAALYLAARYAAQPAHGILAAAFAHGADTDTIGSMVGGLTGCLSGKDWIPRQWLKVQDADYLRQLAIRVTESPGRHVEPSEYPTALKRRQIDLLRRSLSGGRADNLVLDGVRRARVVSVSPPRPSSKSNTVRTWSLRVEDGQTIFVSIHSRTPQVARHAEIESQERGKEGADTAHVPRVSGVKLPVRDVGKAAEFYETVFGLSPSYVGKELATFGALSLERRDGIQQPVERADDHGKAPDRILVQISVPRLREALSRVQMAGGKVREGIATVKHEKRVFHCLDVDGNLIEVLESK